MSCDLFIPQTACAAFIFIYMFYSPSPSSHASILFVITVTKTHRYTYICVCADVYVWHTHTLGTDLGFADVAMCTQTCVCYFVPFSWQPRSLPRVSWGPACFLLIVYLCSTEVSQWCRTNCSSHRRNASLSCPHHNESHIFASCTDYTCRFSVKVELKSLEKIK